MGFLVLISAFSCFTGILYLVWTLGPKDYDSSVSDGHFQIPPSIDQLKFAAEYFSRYKAKDGKGVGSNESEINIREIGHTASFQVLLSYTAHQRLTHADAFFHTRPEEFLITTFFRDKHANYVLLLFALTYLYKQCFAIPGSFFMNLLAGALFGRWRAALLVCPLSAIGASGCYLLSSMVAKSFIDRFFALRFQSLKSAVRQNQSRLLYFLVSARVFPLTPHWLFNIFSPFLDISLSKHALSVFIGLIPYNLICVHAGEMLSEIHKPTEMFNWETTLDLTFLALGIFVFAFFFKANRV
ncbi:unnamed protein product [Enterobius vermicularis]|uniref:Transmembrane protein 41B n=1 Tax=Enterobius vermicularis TaxID=51028 RepID=A0A0N4V353_ENTVE|nr:unnamed protein product [Enterobius vermicularis]